MVTPKASVPIPESLRGSFCEPRNRLMRYLDRMAVSVHRALGIGVGRIPNSLQLRDSSLEVAIRQISQTVLDRFIKSRELPLGVSSLSSQIAGPVLLAIVLLCPSS
ncbi:MULTISPECIES: hypothetical protein [Mesorhizobium]|uniref:hypothetical protein n=1 Tax=Mesorhizobium TaxID=68287 RepID=UPI001FE52BF0|nr:MULTISPECIES: hypothetical protein [Mesorhizobium]